MKWLEMIFALAKLAPEVIKLIGEVETAVGPGNGPAKKALVMAPLAGAPADIQSTISGFVDQVVAAKKLQPTVTGAK